MSEYQIVPYTFSVSVRGKPTELRDLDDLDGSQTLSFLDLIAESGRAHAAETRLPEIGANTSLIVDKVARGARSVCLDVAAGRRGVRADVARTRKGVTSTIDVRERDWTNTTTRCVFIAPPGAKMGIALLERVGHVGAVTNLRNLVDETLKSRYPDLLLRLQPAMSPEVVEKWAAGSKVKGIVLSYTDIKVGESAPSVRGLPVTPVFTVKAPRRKAWSWASLVDKLTPDTQKAILAEVVPQLPGVDPADADSVAAQLLDQGWRVSLEVTNHGKTRKVHVDTKLGVTMTFPATMKNVSTRPQDDDFMAACKQAITELGAMQLSVGTPTLCDWSNQPWNGDGKPAWKAVWGVSESAAASGSP